MARNTRTFTDIDLNFIPSPLTLVKNEGIGLLSCSTSSATVVGKNTIFTKYDMQDRNIYIGTTYIGRVKAVTDSLDLLLYKNANATFTEQAFKYSNPADVVKRYDEQAIKAAVKNLILTNNYERKFHPEIGTQVNSLLFEPATPLLGAVLEKTIRQVIDNYEPRVDVTSVECLVDPDNNKVDVTINFTILNTQTPQVVSFALERTR